MSDIHDEDKIKIEETEAFGQEPKTLDSYDALVKQLRQELAASNNELKQSRVALEETQARISALESAQILSSTTTAIFDLQQELNQVKQGLDEAKHREACGDEREADRRSYIAELRDKLIAAEHDAQVTKKALAVEKEISKAVRSERVELIGEVCRLTVDLGVTKSLLERRI
ncbi:unnamed protein product [Aureobasidium uvarum]|uniref:Uncharacterized protein n=1 Tax=Aureobasidium uvarum TaxID=2773716 RepID=A0A9N8KAE6_9PEZI|nr:unnamed protein product [Aureobasidium uvarum]